MCGVSLQSCPSFQLYKPIKNLEGSSGYRTISNKWNQEIKWLFFKSSYCHHHQKKKNQTRTSWRETPRDHQFPGREERRKALPSHGVSRCESK
ncbi:hypothetical protein NL676_015582 [Syzygium grande]|nr:hypothetical protein NL676_015582 [Syzygium grande]